MQGWESQPKDDTFSECAHKGLAGNLPSHSHLQIWHVPEFQDVKILAMSVFKNRSIRLQTSENLIEF